MAINWERHIKQQKHSKMSVMAYCRIHKLNPPSFYTQRKRLGNKPIFSEVQVIDDVELPGFDLSIQVDSGGNIRFQGTASNLDFMANLFKGR